MKLSSFLTKKFFVMTALGLGLLTSSAQAAYDSQFDVVNFEPAIGSTDYLSVYGSDTLPSKVNAVGFILDYANRPLEFNVAGGAVGRQSIIDHSVIGNFVGAYGFTDWFTFGLNIPVGYSFYFTDDVNHTEDNGAGVGDMTVAAKFRVLDIAEKKVGFAVVPYVTLPTGDIERYMGNGNPTAGLKATLDFQPIDRLTLALNVGGLMRDNIQRVYNFPGGATATVEVDDMLTYGFGANFRFTNQLQGIFETNGSTVIKDMFNEDTTTLEALGAVRYFIGNTGFSFDVGAGGGVVYDGIGTPRFRVVSGLRYTSPEVKPCPPCEAPVVPDRRIQNNKIVLWGKIFYDTAKATIKPISYPVLDDVVDVLRTHPELTLVEVQGHTDARGSDEYNQKLSQARSESARAYLIAKGIDGSRLTAKGYGESKPIASNTEVEGMSQNRRTEFVILSSNSGDASASSSATPAVSAPQTSAPAPTTAPTMPTVAPTTPAPVAGGATAPATAQPTTAPAQ